MSFSVLLKCYKINWKNCNEIKIYRSSISKKPATLNKTVITRSHAGLELVIYACTLMEDNMTSRFLKLSTVMKWLKTTIIIFFSKSHHHYQQFKFWLVTFTAARWDLWVGQIDRSFEVTRIIKNAVIVMNMSVESETRIIKPQDLRQNATIFNKIVQSYIRFNVILIYIFTRLKPVWA